MRKLVGIATLSLFFFFQSFAQAPVFVKSQTNQHIIDSLTSLASELRGKGKWIELIHFGNSNLPKLKTSTRKFSAYQQSLISDEVAYAYLFLSDIEKVKELCNEAIKSLRNEGSDDNYKEQIAQIYLTLARAYGYLKEFEQGNVYLDSASRYLDKSLNLQKRYYLINDIVSNNVELGKAIAIEPLALECYEFFKKDSTDRGLAEIEMLLGRIYFQKNETSKSEWFSKSAIKRTQNPRVLYHCHENLYRIYKAQGNFKEAFFHFELFHEYLDKIFNVNVANEKLSLEKQLIEEKADAALRIEEQKAASEKSLKNYFLSACLVVSIIAFLLYRSREMLNKQNEEIELQNLKIKDLNEGLEQRIAERTLELQKAYDDIKEAMQKGQNLERKRIATDLHDNLGSLLSAVSISLENLDIQGLSEHEKQLYGKISKMMEDAYTEVRSLSHNLHPAEIENGMLGLALEKLIDKLNAQSRIYFQIENYLHEEIFDKKITLNVYAVVLELCNNILKYSGADEAEVLAKMQAKELFILVKDNGQGMGQKAKGSGLKNMENRIEELGGETKIESTPSGTSVALYIPMATAQ